MGIAVAAPPMDAGAQGAAARPLIAALGLALVLFLVLHLAGVGVALVDPVAFGRLVAVLHSAWWLPPLELALAAVGLGHGLAALLRVSRNARAAGAQRPLVLRSRRAAAGPAEALAALAARVAPWSGALLLLFLVVHLLQLRWHRPAAAAELAALRAVLANPGVLLLYGAAGAAAGLHLLHGVESAHRSLGWLDPINAGRIRMAGRWLALLLGGGFTLLPLALVLQGVGR
ncbi:succinate dehydrogenase [Synechococcus sp. CS-1328]|uniref:succinate dehydrogenase n=1 Tax=Synechococcus sp. CS-1328 TaxID=2847976 RepID=UPI00223BFFAB|nr:succinate dehydrogenase [Synechococcus sp. CS-1328]